MEFVFNLSINANKSELVVTHTDVFQVVVPGSQNVSGVSAMILRRLHLVCNRNNWMVTC